MSGIVVIGGGVVGAAATYHLARHGHAVTLIDRQEGGRRALKSAGINLVSILTLEQIANYLMSAGHIEEKLYRKAMEYVEMRRSAE